MGIATELAREIASKIEVLKDLEEPVRELMEAHERKRDLWFPSDILGPQPESSPDDFTRKLRDQASGIPDPIRAALARSSSAVFDGSIRISIVRSRPRRFFRRELISTAPSSVFV